jgi:hypothetical protein
MVKGVMPRLSPRLGVFALVFTWIAACGDKSDTPAPAALDPAKLPAPVVEEHPRPPLFEPPKLERPVPLWENGKEVRTVDGARAAEEGYFLLDLGEQWTPYLFTDGFANDGTPLPNAYRPTYIALARGELPDDYQGERAKDDKYLELYGVVPTLHLVRERMRTTAKLACEAELDLTPIQTFKGLVTYENNNAAKKRADDFVYLRSKVQKLMHEQHVEAPEAIDTTALSTRDKDAVTRYLKQAPEYYAVDAVQKRLVCEGYLKGRGKYQHGALDWATHESLAEFERRHRVLSWGYIGKESLVPLQMSPIEAERAALLRVLVERATHAMGTIEDVEGHRRTASHDSERAVTTPGDRGASVWAPDAGERHGVARVARRASQRGAPLRGDQSPHVARVLQRRHAAHARLRPW